MLPELHKNTPPAPALRALIVDDHEIVREGLRAALENDESLEIVGLASDGTAALEQARARRPALAIVDLHLPDRTGDTLCRELLALIPELSVIILSSYLSEDAVRRSYDAGAVGYVTKAAGLAELRRVIHELHTHDEVVRETSATRIVQHLDDLVARRSGDGTPTPHQVRVFDLLAGGLTYQEISQRLFISQSTVRYHVQNLKLKLGVSSRAELVVSGIKFGLLARPEDEAMSVAAC